MFVGIGVALTAPAVLAATAPASAARSTAKAAEPECLADLIEEGTVRRGDLVAG
jgi:hypothetical protein